MKLRCSGERIIRRLLPGLLLVCLVTVIGPKTASAAAAGSMKNLKGISWDLKANKKITYQSCFSGIGMHDQKAKITKWKITDEGDGFQKLTFKLTVDRRWSVSKSQIHKIANSSLTSKTGEIGGDCGYWVVDYNTGANLEAEDNKYGVTVIYPKDYKGLTIGMSGTTKLKRTKGDKKYIAGKGPFGKTSFFDKKNKKVAHFMRVTK